MTIRAKIYIPIILMLFIFISMFAFGLIYLNSIRAQMEKRANISRIINDYSNRVGIKRQQAREFTLKYRITADKEMLEELDKSTRDIGKLLTQLRPLITSEAGKELLDRFDLYRKEMIISRNELIHSIQTNDISSIDKNFRIWEIKADNASASLQDLISYNQDSLNNILNIYGNVINFIMVAELILIALLIGALLIFNFYLTRTISRPVKKLSLIAHAIAGGNEVVAHTIHSRDELEMLANNLIKMSISLSKYHQSLKKQVDLKELELKETKELERQKDEFIGIASHELKTPITTVKAYTQFMKSMFERQGNTNAVTYLKKMDIQINRLTALISDLLDVTKIQAGKLQLRIREFDFNELVQEIVEEQQLTNTNCIFETKLDESNLVSGDRERIGQVITNFLTNAIKYSPPKNSIILGSKLSPRKIQFFVQDFGPGIPKDQQLKIFDRFYQVEGQVKGNHPGLGLGLYICSEIIKRHKGKIGVVSRKGKGSRFYFQLPAVNRHINLK